MVARTLASTLSFLALSLAAVATAVGALGCIAQSMDETEGVSEEETELLASEVASGAATYDNAVLDENGDPFCARFGDAYYLYLPEQVRENGKGIGGRVRAFKSTDLVSWKSLGVVFDNVDERREGEKSIGLWAPEVFAHKGKFYLYYASLMSGATDEEVGDKDIVVVESDDPTDFRGGKKTVLLDDAYAFIDPSPFKDPSTGKLYLLYKHRGEQGTGTEIRIRPMKSPTAFDGGAKMIVDSEAVPNSDHTVEQPTLYKKGGVYFLLYSKNHGAKLDYHISYATASNPMGPYTQRGVLFGSDDDLSGDVSKKVISPGASSIVLDGAKRPWVVYRQKFTKDETFGDRKVTIDPIEFHPVAKKIEGKPTKGVSRLAPVPLD
jgi:beta-xylosidase